MKKILQFTVIGVALGLAACASEPHPDTRFDSYAAADLNHDQRLSYGEYQNYLASEASRGDLATQRVVAYDQQNRDKAIFLRFQKLDANRDTFVTRDELGF